MKIPLVIRWDVEKEASLNAVSAGATESEPLLLWRMWDNTVMDENLVELQCQNITLAVTS